MFKDDLLKDKRILVTGGGTGLGKEMATHFAKHGAQYLSGGGTFSNLSELSDNDWTEIRDIIRKANNKDKKNRS